MPPMKQESSNNRDVELPDIKVPRQGGDDTITNEQPSPSEPSQSASPTPPEVTMPPGSPLTPLPSTHASPEQSPPLQSQPRARFEPQYDSKGLIIPPPNIGPVPSQGPSSIPTDNSSSKGNVQESHDPSTDDPPDNTPLLAEDDILAGMVFVSQDVEYISYADALEIAFQAVMEVVMKASSPDNEPKTLAEAMSRPGEEADRWYEAAQQELAALQESGTFELIELPPGRKAIARYVVKGYSQRPGFDYTETFSPTPKWSAIRTVLALAALEDLELWSVDISSAFLNGDLQEEVYLEQPEGFETKGKDWVLRLFKSIYGLKQAGREWHKKLHGVMTEMGFDRVRCEHSVWVYKKDDARIIVPVFVDDVTIAVRSMESVRQVIEDLKKHFKLRDLGPTSYLLGVEIQRDRSSRTLTICQRQYILNVLERARMSDCNSVSTPLDPHLKLSSSMSPTTPEEWKTMRHVPYLQILGAVAYLAIVTCPDIAFAVSVLSRFSKNPGTQHWEALKRLLRYLKGTVDLKLTYSPDATSSELFRTYTDADHGGNPDNGRSTSGFVVKMGTGAVSWMSRLQSMVTLSTTEAEYVAAVAAGQEILWLRNLFKEFGFESHSPSTLHINNQSVLSVARNPDHHGRVKHLDLRFYWLHDEVD
ncbi:uncharacterized protein ARMOST_18444 [Armillaria ostoyae]|uniref:Reverse transcriptase Ty1/copia-type domain-containing protein n=1 Tax=Armillaria ostoyae TaxID=47428 RepID=A0A284S1V9_ARMOS|nr:uncharacterized protein ARMOST_18444 [Armillaria ostoyae]